MSGNGTTHERESVQRILEERARALACPPEQEDAGESTPMLVLAVGVERYCVDIDLVQEIKPLSGLTPVPDTPPFWRGLVNLRGSLYPVLDLRRFLGLAEADSPGGGTVVVVAGEGVSVALLVDDVPESVRVAPADLLPPPAEGIGGRTEIVRAMTPDLLCVLDLAPLLRDPSLVVQAEVN
jgi:purine-binding chemotaxis protein CheW